MPTVILRPIGNGDIIQNNPSPSDLPNWDCVDEEVANGDTDYVWCPIIGSGSTDDLYLLPSVSGVIPTGSAINSVTVYITVRNTMAGYGLHYSLIKTHATGYLGTTHSPTDTVYHAYGDIYEVNPYTGLAWTIEEVDNLQSGIRLKTEYNRLFNIYLAGRCTQVYVVVDYTPPEYVLTINVDKDVGYVGKEFIFSGELTFTGSPVTGQVVTLYRDSVGVGSDVTDDNGAYSIPWTADVVGTYDFYTEATV